MASESYSAPAGAEQHWQNIIAAVKGSAAAEVWFQFRREGGFSQPLDEPEAPNLASRLGRSGGEWPSGDAA